MADAIDNIKIIGTATSVNELNAAYNEAVLQAEQFAINGVFERQGQTFNEVLSTLNHIANYNIVRIANNAFKEYEDSGRTNQGCLVEIALCRDSLKQHEEMQTEQELLDNLCECLSIN